LTTRRIRVTPGCLTALNLRADEKARVVHLCNGRAAEFLLVVARGVPSGRALSVIHLVDGALGEEEFKYRMEVFSEAGVLSLSGQAKGVERPTKEYKPSAFLFVPDAISGTQLLRTSRGRSS
ncbi:hypothetical protein EJB05_31845, partial [Eragrostis curvula]